MIVLKSVRSSARMGYMYWLVVCAASVYLWLAPANTPNFILPWVAAMTAAGIALKSVTFRWRSFTCIFIICHIISFGLSTFLILTLPSAASLAMEEGLWQHIPLSLWAMALGMLGLAAAAYISRKLLHEGTHKEALLSLPSSVTPVSVHVALASLSLLVAVAQILTGTYFHKDIGGIESYNTAAANSFGFIGYLSYCAYAGIVLQLRRQFITQSRTDVKWTCLCVALPLAATLPSGGRTNTFVILGIVLLYFLHHESRTSKKVASLFAGVLLMASTALALEAYRISSSNDPSASVLTHASAVFSEVSDSEHSRWEAKQAILARRMADNASVAHLIDIIPSQYPHRGAEDFELFPLFILPTMFRPAIQLDFNYDAYLMMDHYQFRTEIGGSSPMMVIGELYERFGWIGIFFGMFTIGALLIRLDAVVLGKSAFAHVLWALLFHGVLNMYTYSILKIFVLGTRQLAIFICIYLILAKIILLVDNRRLQSLAAVRPR